MDFLAKIKEKAAGSEVARKRNLRLKFLSTIALPF